MKEKKESSTLSLDKVKTGESGVIDLIAGDSHFAGRTAGKGFTPEAEIVVVQNFGVGPIIVYLRDTQIALGRNEAEKIIVRRNNGD